MKPTGKAGYGDEDKPTSELVTCSPQESSLVKTLLFHVEYG